MSGFFDRLAGRARGEAPLVQPLPRPLFAPERVEPAGEPELDAAAAPATVATSVAPPSSDAPARRQTRSATLLMPGPPAARDGSRDGSSLATTAVTRASAVAADDIVVTGKPPRLLMPAVAPTLDDAPMLSRLRDDDEADRIEPAPARDLANVTASASETHAPTAAARRDRSLRPAAPAHPRPAPPLPTPAMTLEPPIVHVTIGRIDVRATPPPAPPPRRAPTPERRSSLSLEQYLAERYRGQR